MISHILENRLTAADVNNSDVELGLIQPDAAYPLSGAFSVGQTDYWKPPEFAAAVKLEADGGNALGLAWGGSLSASVIWRDRFDAVIDSVEIFGSGAAIAATDTEPDNILVTVQSGGRIYRLVRGMLRSFDAAVLPSSELPPSRTHDGLSG